jgi:hypothetical protein
MEIPNQTINSFFTRAVQRDFTRDYLFRIESITFDGPEGVTLGPSELLYAKSGKLPARGIVNQTVSYAGQKFNIPGASEFPGSEAYDIDFYCPEDSHIREILMNESTRTFGNIFGLAGSGSDGGSIANANSRIILLQLNKALDPIYQYDLIGCTIRNVGELSYNIAEGNGAVVSFPVTIAYHYFVRTQHEGVIAAINR